MVGLTATGEKTFCSESRNLYIPLISFISNRTNKGMDELTARPQRISRKVLIRHLIKYFPIPPSAIFLSIVNPSIKRLHFAILGKENFSRSGITFESVYFPFF